MYGYVYVGEYTAELVPQLVTLFANPAHTIKSLEDQIINIQKNAKQAHLLHNPTQKDLSDPYLSLERKLLISINNNKIRSERGNEVSTGNTTGATDLLTVTGEGSENKGVGVISETSVRLSQLQQEALALRTAQSEQVTPVVLTASERVRFQRDIGALEVHTYKII